MSTSEAERVELLRSILAGTAPELVMGIGDDAAVLTVPPEARLIWTTDAAVQDVHFRRGWLSLHDVGFRATMAAASDVAAMGGRVVAALAALILPPSFADDELAELARGQAEAMAQLGAPLAGGNLARGDTLSITTTVLGAVDRAVLRDGARAGDRLWLAGPVGLAAAGLAWLSAHGEEGAARVAPAGLTPAVEAWRRPVARIAAGRGARPVARAMIDVSDGLAIDLGRLLTASGGLGARLERAALVDPALAAAAAEVGRDSVELALAGGEDYALLAAAPPDAELEGFRAVGVVTADPALSLVDAGGDSLPFSTLGYDHFR